MKDKRQGNDLKVAWSIFMQDGEPFRLDGKGVSLYLKNMFGRKELNDFVTTGNIIQWTFYGKDQKNSGKYSLELVINEGEKGMITTDKCDFVNLVSCSCKLQGGEDAPNVETESIELTSTLEYVSGGGEYDDTALWRALDGKVDKVEGKGLSTNDFTDEEKEKLAGLENYDDAELKEELSETYQPKENIYYLDWDSASGSGELDEATYQAIMAADKVCLKHGTSITEPISKASDGVECAYGFVADKYYGLFVSESNYVIFPSPYYDDSELREAIEGLDNRIAAHSEEIVNLQENKAEKSELTELSAEVSGLSEKIENLPSGESDVFYAEYGVTTYDEIVAAYNEGKHVLCIYNNNIAQLTQILESVLYLFVIGANAIRLSCFKGGTWSYKTYNFAHELTTLDNGNAQITIAGKTAEVATPQYVETLLGTIINGDY